MEGYYWSALYVKSRTEKKVVARLKEKGIKCFLPTVKTKVQWSDRLKTVEKVVIPGYVFVKISEREYYDVLNLPSVVTYVHSDGKAAKIRESQIDSMRLLFENSPNVQKEECGIELGASVSIEYGPFKGFVGRVSRVKSTAKLTVVIEQLGFCLSLEVPNHYLAVNKAV